MEQHVATLIKLRKKEWDKLSVLISKYNLSKAGVVRMLINWAVENPQLFEKLVLKENYATQEGGHGRANNP